MYNTGNSDLKCTEYSIPINSSVLGYLQFYHNDTIAGKTDVVSIKTYVVDLETGVVTPISALNKLSQYLGDGEFQTIIQGLTGFPELNKFKFKTEIVYGGSPNVTKNYYSPVYARNDCEDISVIIPCLIGGQQYTINGNFVDTIEGNIVYQSWHSATEKKYSPAVFLRNVNFNRKANVVEFKKLNNKPLKTTLKRNYGLFTEPVSVEYVNELDDVFSFGKVNILGTTYVLDSYSVEPLDEKDCCTLYKVIATAYKESKLRLLCSNNCTILEPIDCDDLVSNNYVNLIDVSVPEYSDCSASQANINIESLVGVLLNKGLAPEQEVCLASNIDVISIGDVVLAEEFATNTPDGNVPLTSLANINIAYGY